MRKCTSLESRGVGEYWVIEDILVIARNGWRIICTAAFGGGSTVKDLPGAVRVLTQRRKDAKTQSEESNRRIE
jgi:hypothetical protein